jgi:hypothetical protein
VQVVNNQNSAIAVQVVITFKNPDGTLSRQNVSGELFRRMFNGYFSGKLGQENNQLYGPVFNVAK